MIAWVCSQAVNLAKQLSPLAARELAEAATTVHPYSTRLWRLTEQVAAAARAAVPGVAAVAGAKATAARR